MLLTLLSWIYIMVLTVIPGRCCFLLLRPAAGPEAGSSGRSMPQLPAFATPEVWLLTGLAAAAVYAQIYSLFGGVGAAANALLVLICAGLILAAAGKWRNGLWAGQRGLRLTWSMLVPAVMCAAVVLFLAAVTAQTPTHYDTYLYHAQAIHWIEEYGCVIGLGNLHNRFAYNSSFLVLQALFSLKFLTGRSLHTLNGYVAALFLCYCLCSLKAVRRKGLFLSDALRAGLVYYLLHNSTYLSSPNTDTFALSLAFYIFIKWSDCLEEGEDHVGPYAWLCLMAVYACTLKLSSAFLLILLIKPICMIFRGETAKKARCGKPVSDTAGRTVLSHDKAAGTKEEGRVPGSAKGPACSEGAAGGTAAQESEGRHPWRQFAFYAGCAIVVAAPYFLRNILLSGYVLYPYSFLDIIPFADWKMDAGVLDYDRLEIMAWGRAIYDVTQMDQPITQWLPTWFAEQNSVGKREILIAAVSAAGLLVTDAVLTVQWLLKKRRTPKGKEPQSGSQKAFPSGKLSGGEKIADGEKLTGGVWAASGGEFSKRRGAAQENRPVVNAGDCAEARRWRLPDWLLFSLASVCCLAGWLFSAPLLRYGEVYLIIISAVFVLYWMQRIFMALKGAGPLPSPARPQGSEGKNAAAASEANHAVHGSTFAARLCAGRLWGLTAMLLVLLRGGMMQLAYYPNGFALQYQDYLVYDCEAVTWEGVTIYIPSDGTTQTGYDPFPAVFSADTLKELELRGEDLGDGIRQKE